MDGTVISNILKVDYGYHNIDRTKTTARIGTMTYTRPASSIRPVPEDYFYDNEGKPYKLTVDEDNSTSGGYYTGYFVLNQQGDVIAILNANGAKAVSYEYNAWGQIKEETAASTNVGTLFLEHNALKYRGYYYDAETGFYYVSSRYYDPVIGRFINADTTDVLLASPTSLTKPPCPHTWHHHK